MITDPWFYAVAIPAVLIVGLAKGGFGGALAMLGVPVMSLAISPVLAAGILLPILVLMDLTAVAAYRGIYHWPSLKVLLPGAAAGVLVGWLTAAYVSETHVRLIIGLIAIAFVMNAWFQGAITPRPAGAERASTNAGGASSTDRAGGAFWGSVAGFTSFVSHAGGPPFQVHMLPKGLAPRLLAGTSVIFFFVTNQMKLIPYWALGQFSAENLTTSAVLFPVALLAVGIGVWLVKVVRPETFYRVIYLVLFIVGIRLVWTSLSALATA